MEENSENHKESIPDWVRRDIEKSLAEIVDKYERQKILKKSMFLKAQNSKYQGNIKHAVTEESYVFDVFNKQKHRIHIRSQMTQYYDRGTQVAGVCH